jgi:hypothetical protein
MDREEQHGHGDAEYVWRHGGTTRDALAATRMCDWGLKGVRKFALTAKSSRKSRNALKQL